jgi:hypothetical protein
MTKGKEGNGKTVYCKTVKHDPELLMYVPQCPQVPMMLTDQRKVEEGVNCGRNNYMLSLYKCHKLSSVSTCDHSFWEHEHAVDVAHPIHSDDVGVSLEGRKSWK